jgi:hypothetical protein
MDFTSEVGLSTWTFQSCSFGGRALGEIGRLGGEDGGVRGGMFSSEKRATSDDGRSDDGGSDDRTL